MPPPALLEEAEDVGAALFVAAPDLAEWARKTFIESGGHLRNSDHEHLEGASIGFLWTNLPLTKGDMLVMGQAELAIPFPRPAKWQLGRRLQQLRDWFSETPDFLITLYAPEAATRPDLEFCALVEHELYHCGQRVQGKQLVWCMRPHDVEEFVGVVERYGVGGGAGRTRDLVRAAQDSPSVGAASISAACGTCARKAA